MLNQTFTKLQNMSMKGKVSLLVLTFVVGFLTFGLVTFTTLKEIRVGGPRYANIVQDKDLLADALPPCCMSSKRT